jgi:NAD(P)-dependent dehydrogenase (short-subunit alcohol dehydrogenase family)
MDGGREQGIEGRTVLITGASRGIGAAAAREFAGRGAQVALLARGMSEIADLAGELGAERAIAIPCDVARWQEVAQAVDATVDAFGPVDVVIANAGVIEPVAMIAESDPEGWRAAIEINLTGAYHTIRAALPGMLARGSGTVLTVSSGAAHRALPGWSHYCASKAGAKMLTEAVHAECGDVLRVMGLSPGTVATQMQREIKASGVGPVASLDWEDHIPPEWPARALAWMTTSAADDLLGTELSLRDVGLRSRIGLG